VTVDVFKNLFVAVWAPDAVVFVRIGPIHFVAGCRKPGLVWFSFWGYLCISLGFLYLSWLL